MFSVRDRGGEREREREGRGRELAATSARKLIGSEKGVYVYKICLLFHSSQ